MTTDTLDDAKLDQALTELAALRADVTAMDTEITRWLQKPRQEPQKPSKSSRAWRRRAAAKGALTGLAIWVAVAALVLTLAGCGTRNTVESCTEASTRTLQAEIEAAKTEADLHKRMDALDRPKQCDGLNEQELQEAMSRVMTNVTPDLLDRAFDLAVTPSSTTTACDGCAPNHAIPAVGEPCSKVGTYNTTKKGKRVVCDLPTEKRAARGDTVPRWVAA